MRCFCSYQCCILSPTVQLWYTLCSPLSLPRFGSTRPPFYQAPFVPFALVPLPDPASESIGFDTDDANPSVYQWLCVRTPWCVLPLSAACIHLISSQSTVWICLCSASLMRLKPFSPLSLIDSLTSFSCVSLHNSNIVFRTVYCGKVRI